jgi:hypothetical protein
MGVPMKAPKRPADSQLPPPELVDLIGHAYADSPSGWWTQYGGALDAASGVVYLPPGSGAPCALPECRLKKQGATP